MDKNITPEATEATPIIAVGAIDVGAAVASASAAVVAATSSTVVVELRVLSWVGVLAICTATEAVETVGG
jgi:hypothetical protein